MRAVLSLAVVGVLSACGGEYTRAAQELETQSSAVRQFTVWDFSNPEIFHPMEKQPNVLKPDVQLFRLRNGRGDYAYAAWKIGGEHPPFVRDLWNQGFWVEAGPIGHLYSYSGFDPEGLKAQLYLDRRADGDSILTTDGHPEPGYHRVASLGWLFPKAAQGHDRVWIRDEGRGAFPHEHDTAPLYRLVKNGRHVFTYINMKNEETIRTNEVAGFFGAGWALDGDGVSAYVVHFYGCRGDSDCSSDR